MIELLLATSGLLAFMLKCAAQTLVGGIVLVGLHKAIGWLRP